MKERLVQVIKWFLIILGLLFLLQIVVISIALFGVSRLNVLELENMGIKKPKEIQSVINYIERYKLDNKTYPKNLENAKLNKDFEYSYELSDDNNCYTLEVKSNKNNKVQSYSKCDKSDKNSTTQKESYTLYKSN